MFRSVLLPSRTIGKVLLKNKVTNTFKNTFKPVNATRSLCTAQAVEEEAPSDSLVQRFQVTAEVVVSKLFPAGFGWQYGSIIADAQGFQATDMGFFAITGLGDFTGVFLGHTLFYGLKGATTGKVNMDVEMQTAWFLGSAAFCSGAIWQPAVNFLQMTNAPFMSVAGCTWAACGLAFYGGLRFFRQVYSPIFSAVEGPHYQNLKGDASLSLAIGGGTSAFVGTDVAYLNGEGNFLRPIVGIEEGMSDLEGCIKAGTSTGLGFAVAQTAENLVWPRGKLWVD